MATDITQEQLDARLAAHNAAVAKRQRLSYELHRDPGPQPGEFTASDWDEIYQGRTLADFARPRPEKDLLPEHDVMTRGYYGTREETRRDGIR